MLKLTKGIDLDFERYLDDLNELGFIYASRKDLSRVYEYVNAQVETLRTLCVEIMTSKSGYSYNNLDSKQIANYLIYFERCPENMIFKRGKLSLDSKKVLKPLFDKGFAQEFISMYMQFTSSRSIRGYLRKIIEDLEKTDEVDSSGNNLYRIRFAEIKEAPNRRVYYNNKSIQQIPSIANVALKAPSDYVIVSGDFKQSDVRIAYSLFLKDSSNINLMTSSDDIYEVYARMFLGDSFDKNYFKEHRDEFKVLTLAPVYGAKSGMTPFANNYISKANEYLKHCDRYQEYLRRINKHIDLNMLNGRSGIGLPLYITSYFGFEQAVSLPPYSTYDVKKARTDLINKALNVPVQTGTSEIVVATERAIMDKFAEVGVTSENGGIYAYMNRHDELVFLLKADNLKYSYIFQEHEDVIVDDWIPLKIEFEYQTTYKQPNEEVTKLAKSFYKPKEELPKNYLESNSTYMPISDICEIGLGYSANLDLGVTFVSFYDSVKRKVSFEVYNTTNCDELLNGIIGTISRNSKEFIDSGVQKLIIYSTLSTEKSLSISNLLINLSSKCEASVLSDAKTLALYCEDDFLKQKGLPKKNSEVIQDSLPFIKSVLSNGELINGW